MKSINLNFMKNTENLKGYRELSNVDNTRRRILSFTESSNESNNGIQSLSGHRIRNNRAKMRNRFRKLMS